MEGMRFLPGSLKISCNWVADGDVECWNAVGSITRFWNLILYLLAEYSTRINFNSTYKKMGSSLNRMGKHSDVSHRGHREHGGF